MAKRLIDANDLMQSRPEYRNQNDVINSDFNCGWNACNREYWNLIAGSPTVDAVEVVHVIRCKDCKYWKPGDSKGGNSIEDLQVIGGCKWTKFCRREMDFCSFGERKDNGHSYCN